MDSELRKAIVKELGLEALSPADQDSAIERIGAVVFQKVLMRAFEQLSDADRLELEKAVSDPSKPEVLFTFLQAKVPNFDQLIKEELANFKADAAEVMGQIQNPS